MAEITRKRTLEDDENASDEMISAKFSKLEDDENSPEEIPSDKLSKLEDVSSCTTFLESLSGFRVFNLKIKGSSPMSNTWWELMQLVPTLQCKLPLP